MPFIFLVFVVLSNALSDSTQRSSPLHIREISFAEAAPVLKDEDVEKAIPPELRDQDPKRLQALWPQWVKARDAETRRRLATGCQDSLVNLLLFGTSYTRQPRLTPDRLWALRENPETRNALLQGRIHDLVVALNRPQNNERLQFMRRFLEAKGYGFQNPANQIRVAEYLVSSFKRMLSDAGAYKEMLEVAEHLQDPNEEFARRSTLFENRGLSIDTSLMPNFAVEEALKQVKRVKLAAPGGVRRIGIIGPGLDFVDKTSGYDFYPEQTIQPFALMDSLLRLELASSETLQVTTFDISPQVNQHLASMAAHSQRGQSYVVQLPLDNQKKWRPEAIQYWQRFGNMIGTSVAPLPPPSAVGNVRTRAVRIPPAIAQKIRAIDANVIYQRPELSADERFDLLLVTNVLIYYNVFEQSLAMVNIAQMLRPGGILLSNDNLLEVGDTPLHLVGYVAIPYSDRSGDGDRILCYQRD
ncbi:MAG TPA: class I SAM-dependent methyltransferase [Terriglobales bacterium]|nr:class I SAM-dependent methyltransferase [Terriglobales bacterium]